MKVGFSMFLGAVLAAVSMCGVADAVEGGDSALAKTIMDDARLTEVLARAKAIIATGFNAGDGYGEVWIRDLATFIDLSCQVYKPEEIRDRLLMFFRFQQDNGEIIDGYIPRANANVAYDYIKKDGISDYLGHKNTVETDQESSLILAVCRYVRATGDAGILAEEIDGISVARRMELAMDYLLKHRFAEEYGLIWGATTADWGDVQPEHEWGVRLDESSHKAIDIYDNALFITAIDDYLDVVKPVEQADRWNKVRDGLRTNARKHLWDEKNKKFVPHIYLDGSPFPADFDENQIYYHGGTAVAIEAGLLSREEAGEALARMVANVKAANAGSIGLTMYPPYPQGMFKNPGMAAPYSYQNGGDWTWFGGRMIQQLVRHGFVEEAYREVLPMVERVVKNDGFFEWYSRENEPRGSGTFRGSAGVLGKAIEMLREWAKENLDASSEAEQANKE